MDLFLLQTLLYVGIEPPLVYMQGKVVAQLECVLLVDLLQPQL